jgi:ABC-type sugar transport system permease subunit
MERLSFAFYNLIQITFLFVHYPTTRRFPPIVSFACLLLFLFYCYTEYSLQSPGEDYVLGCSNAILLLTAAHITFLCPDFSNGIQWTGLTTRRGPTPIRLPFAQKLGWMAELASNMRRIGVARDSGAMSSPAADAGVDKREPASASARKRFVISRVILSISCLAVFHCTLLYRLGNPSFNPTLHNDAQDGKFIRAHSSVLPRFWEVLVWTAGTVSEMTFLQTAAAVLSVGFGASRPEDWPSMFGSPTHAYSVRRFWS